MMYNLNRAWAFTALQLLLSFVAALLLIPDVSAQNGSAPKPFFFPRRTFSIPFSADDRNVRQVKLYCSTNNGVNWELYSTASPGDRGFSVRVDRDGTYAFAIQSIYSDGSVSPPRLDQLQPQQIVVVDTEPPTIQLRSISPESLKNGNVKVGVEWDIHDANLDINSIRLEGRYTGQNQWRPIQNKTLAIRGEDVWSLQPGYRMEVRMRAMDKAGNANEATVTLGSTVGQMTAGGGSNDNGLDSPGRGVTPPQVIYSNTKRVTINFDIKKMPPSGLEAIDLWMTRNRQDWKKAQQVNQLPAPGAEKATLVYEANEDGLYGFTIVARSMAKLSSGEPASGREPQIWVEVDTQPPKIEQFDVRVGSSQDSRSVAIVWKVTDKNLTRESIILEYARDQTADKWDEIAKDLECARDGTGRYIWPKPEGEPYKFYVRIRAIDRAGNVATQVYKDPLIVDFVRPEVEIKGVEPMKP
jgi:hypothetical protein